MMSNNDDLPPGIIRARNPNTQGTLDSSEETETAPFISVFDDDDEKDNDPTQPERKQRSRSALPEFTKGENRITAIDPQVRHKERVSIFIDGEFALGVFETVVENLGLRVGQQITPKRLNEIVQAENVRKGIEDAYQFLSYRARSEKEITDRLKRKGHDEEVIGEVIIKMRELGFVDDAQFAESWAKSRGTTRGRRALAHELRQKGIDSETVQSALAEVKDDDAERQAAQNVAIQKVGARPSDCSREAQARLAAFLQRRGFGWDDIKPVLRELFSADSLSDENDTAITVELEKENE